MIIGVKVIDHPSCMVCVVELQTREGGWSRPHLFRGNTPEERRAAADVLVLPIVEALLGLKEEKA